jgi:hypothetical protein
MALWGAAAERGSRGSRAPSPSGTHAERVIAGQAHDPHTQCQWLAKDRRDRESAHYKWAERYSRYGDAHRAASHFGTFG